MKKVLFMLVLFNSSVVYGEPRYNSNRLSKEISIDKCFRDRYNNSFKRKDCVETEEKSLRENRYRSYKWENDYEQY